MQYGMRTGSINSVFICFLFFTINFQPFIYKLKMTAMFCILALLNCILIVSFSDDMELWYDAPPLSVFSSILANETMKDDMNWLQALPLGNGMIGAMVYGGINLERIQLNEKSLWSGSFSDSDNDQAPANLVRNMLIQY